MRFFTLACLLLKLFAVSAQTTQATLKGTLKDSLTREELIGASVKISQNGVFLKGAITDFNGCYRVLLEPGAYDVEFFYTGYISSRRIQITVKAGQTTSQNGSFSAGESLSSIQPIYCFPPRLIDKSPGNSGATFTSEMLRHAY